MGDSLTIYSAAVEVIFKLIILIYAPICSLSEQEPEEIEFALYVSAKLNNAIIVPWLPVASQLALRLSRAILHTMSAPMRSGPAEQTPACSG